MTESALKLVDSFYKVVTYPAKELPEQYRALVYSKWLRSLRYGNPFFERIPSDTYFKNYHTFIESLMSKPDSLVKLAVLTDEPDTVMGFSSSREDVLDYIHVHKDQRKLGIAKKLLPPKVTAFTHMTRIAKHIWLGNEKYKHWQFNPKI